MYLVRKKAKKDYYEELRLKEKRSEIIMNNELPKQR